MRVLHLLDPTSDWPALHAVATLVAAAPAEHALAILGAPALTRLAEHLGLPFDRLSNPRSPHGLGRYLAHRPAPTVIHAWSLTAAHAAQQTRLAAPVVLTLWQRPANVNWLQRRKLGRTIDRSRVNLVASASLPAEYAATIAPLADPRIIPLPVTTNRIDPSARDRFRTDWGFTPTTTAIACIADPARSADARMIGYQAGVLSIAGRTTAAIVPPDARDIERARRFRGHHKDREWEIVVEDRPLWEWLPACEVCVWSEDPGLRTGMRLMRTPPSAIGLAWAAAAGIPIIAEDVPATRELLGDNAATFVTPGNRLELNRALLRIIDDTELRAERIAAGRRAIAAFTPAIYISAMNSVYAQAATA